MQLRASFAGQIDIREGAPVRIAGVDVGKVNSVRTIQTASGIETDVLMDIQTSYDLRIPKDAVVRAYKDGLLGSSYANIDVTHASGPPANSGETLLTDGGN